MSGLVAAVERRVPDRCLAQRCRRDNCSVSLADAPTDHVLVDLDCDTLQNRHQGKRCDYLFVGEDTETVWVVPIELKSGRFKAGEVAEQLRGGAALAGSWLPDGSSFRLVPVLACGRGIHKQELKTLRAEKIGMREQTKQAVLIRCGQALRAVLR